MTTMQNINPDIVARVDELADKCADIIRKEARRLLCSGGIDPEKNADKPYWLPKLVVSVACEHAASQWENRLDSNWLNSRRNLRCF